MTAVTLDPVPRTQALTYAMRGWHVFPVWEMRDGNCACPQRQNCPHPGKHPRLGKAYEPSKDADVITSWWKKWPKANIGIMTGPSGLVVVDVDPRNLGDESFHEMEARFGELPRGPVAHTGGGGWHYFLKAPEHVDVRTTALGPGLELKARTGYVVAAPSIHLSGKTYAWDADRGLEEPLPDCPPWLVKLAGSQSVDEWQSDPGGPLAGVVGASFAAAGMVGRRLGKDTAAVTCPWDSDHTVGRPGDSSTVVFAPSVGNKLGWFHCSHSHCADKGPREALEALPEAAVLAALKRLGVDESWSPSAIQRPHADWALPPTGGDDDDDGVSDVPVPEQPGSDAWKRSLRFDGAMRITKDAGNAALILAHDDAWAGCLAKDTFRGGIVWLKSPPPMPGLLAPKPGEPMKHSHNVYIQQWLAKYRMTSFPPAAVEAAVISAAEHISVDPLQEYIQELEWDGTHRLATFASTYLGIEDDEYTRCVIRWWMISAIARAMEPGIKADYVLVLEGDQGARKTQLLEALGGEWFVAALPSISNKDSLVVLDGAWLVCIDELAGLQGVSNEAVKSFLTTRSDTFRPPYGRDVVRRPRRCVFAATTNAPEYLTDGTGGRRYWPLACKMVKSAKVSDDRDQLWAEAKLAWSAGETWYPENATTEAIVKEQQELRQIDDPIADRIAAHIQPASETSTNEVMRALGINPASHDAMKMARRIGTVLRRLGWTKKKGRYGIRWARP